MYFKILQGDTLALAGLTGLFAEPFRGSIWEISLFELHIHITRVCWARPSERSNLDPHETWWSSFLDETLVPEAGYPHAAVAAVEGG